MRIKKIIHADGSVSYASKSISVVKNKENPDEQTVTEVQSEAIPELELPTA
jgi:hypothetical protein